VCVRTTGGEEVEGGGEAQTTGIRDDGRAEVKKKRGGLPGMAGGAGRLPTNHE